MPALNLRNVLRRNPSRPSLKERAAALKAAAGRAIRRPEMPATPAASQQVDPHIAMLPALRQAFAWTRDAHPFGECASNSPEDRAFTAVLHHCWGVAHAIVALPPPATLAGLGALALALSVHAEEAIGRPQDDGLDDQRYTEERRLAVAIRAMMAASGVEPLPEWAGFEAGPDSDAKWEALKARAGKGSAPAWAFEGKAGPDDMQEV